MKYHDICVHLEKLGPYMSDVIGKCRRHVLAFNGSGTSRIDKYLLESATYAAAEQGRNLQAEYAEGSPKPGVLAYVENRKGNLQTQFPVWVNEAAGVVKQANGEAYGLIEDVYECLHYRDAGGELHPWPRNQDTNAPVGKEPTQSEIDASDSAKSTIGTEDPKIGRRQQSHWRKRVEELYGTRCVVTGCENRALLRASHIKRWANGTTAERLDPNNGLMLAAHIDAAFEVGLISFADDGRILISSQLSASDRKVLNITGAERLAKLTDASKGYLAWHRQRHGF